MHELTLAQDAVNTILTTARQNNFTAVGKVVFEVGQLSCVDADALKFAMAAATANTLAQRAEIIIKSIVGRLQCKHCQQCFSSAELYVICPACGKVGAAIVAGNQVFLSCFEGS